MKKAATNLSASVRQRLLNLANEKRQDFGMLLTNYALERRREDARLPQESDAAGIDSAGL